MSKFYLQEDKSYSSGGFVFFSKGTGWIRETGVFIPSFGFSIGLQPVPVILWLHGFYVPNARHIFYKEATRLLPALIDADKPVVLIAPELGWYQNEKQSTYDSGALGGGKKAQQFLDQVLQALTDWYVKTIIGGEIEMMSEAPGRMEISDLYVAGHSGGGRAVVKSVAALGGHRDKLRECWGFDSLYGSGQFWYEWAQGLHGLPLYFYYGRGTQPAANGDVLGFWQKVYGTPKHRVATRMPNLYLAPALPGAERDQIAFQSVDAIKGKTAPGNRYEEVRRKVDPLLDDSGKYWSTILKEGLKGHYETVSDLLGSRVRQSLP